VGQKRFTINIFGRNCKNGFGHNGEGDKDLRGSALNLTRPNHEVSSTSLRTNQKKKKIVNIKKKFISIHKR
jgi:hypothetical protein